MISTTLSPAHTPIRRAIAAHFAGRTTTAAEAAMRAHLLTCPPCKDHYQRHLTLAQLDPRALPAADRIARGLGLPRRASGGGGAWRARLIAGLAVPVAALAVAAFALVPGGRSGRVEVSSPPADTSAAFTPRGPGASVGRGASFWIYRVGVEGMPRLAEQGIARADELAFAYSNPVGKRFLAIFGVDEHRHVYWFHPIWQVGRPAPAAVRATAGPGPYELPGAIRHALDGRRLSVYAAFSDRALDATTVEAAVEHRPQGTSGGVPALGQDVVVIERTYEVRP